ncbi:hypothetical protein F5984_19170 [Rudanella paleaurantiibacter]|uniref:Uncharacterized protein n=1 Tax=Rudanella paleaurantiibacter TaxID=2614655 RepID=A0A7J5TUQ2_9BACT|nr:hypothetical protein [Rudanella paleaurantiibacter]KAB7727892.1 hypothetical protein F5984_19170 [Rudanella paleaurantiibacter]
MKLSLLLLLLVSSLRAVAQIGLGGTPNPNAVLDLKSPNKGLLIPRTSTTTRQTIPPVKGLMVYDTTQSSFWYHTGAVWREITDKWQTNGSVLFSNNWIGIQTNSPAYALDVGGSVRAQLNLRSDNDALIERDVHAKNNLYAYNRVGIGTLSPTQPLDVVGNARISENLQVNGNFGIVRSNSSTQLKMSLPSGNLILTLQPNVFFDVTFNMTTFTGTPRVSIAQVVSTGNTWHQIILTVHDVNTTTNTFKVRFYNAGNSTAVFDGTLNLMVVGQP